MPKSSVYSTSADSYKLNGHLICEGYDFERAIWWARIDFGSVREFHSRDEMEQAIREAVAA